MIVVTGATGNVGSEIVAVLAGQGTGVRAVSRRGAAAGFPAGVEPVTGDLADPAGLTPAFAGADGLFLMSGYDGTPELLAAARDAGVRRVALLSGGSADGGDPGNAVAAYMMKTEAEVRASGLEWTFLRPTSFMTNALRWLPQLQAGDVVTAEFPDVPIATIDPADIAAVAATALLSGDYAGQALPLTGPEALRPADRLAVLADVLGRDLTFVPQSDEDAYAQMSDSMPKEYVDAFFAFFAEGTLDETTIRPTVEQVTGRPATTFRAWAETHADAFR
jgi:uncharacterized protein YbjT (DUF2867 family)